MGGPARQSGSCGSKFSAVSCQLSALIFDIQYSPFNIRHSTLFTSDPPASARDGFEADAAADLRGDDPQLRHQTVELRGKHRLCAVAERVVGVTVDLDQQTVS